MGSVARVSAKQITANKPGGGFLIMSEWKPIKLAPRDTSVLIFDGEIIGVAKFWSNYKFWKCVGASGWEMESDFSNPTHFQYLPQPPISSALN